MKKVRVKLAELFRSKATEESAEGQTTETNEEEDGESGESTEEGAEGESGEGESGEEDGGEGGQEDGGEGESGEGQATGEASEVREIEMTAAEYNTMKTNAAEYVKVKGELETLRGWKASMDKMNGGLGRADQSTLNGKTGPSVLDAPWNKAALDAAEKVK